MKSLKSGQPSVNIDKSTLKKLEEMKNKKITFPPSPPMFSEIRPSTRKGIGFIIQKPFFI